MVKILFLAANPSNTEPLCLDEEVRSITQALRLAEFRDEVMLFSHWAVRISDLQDLFLQHQPHVVHFSGHGSKASEIVLKNEMGQGVIVPAEALSSLFQIFQSQIRCVVLSACYSAKQAEAIGTYIDSVIGISDAITDKAAMRFSTAFYRGIGYGQDVLTGYNLGCNQLELERIDESHKPLLFGKADPTQIRFAGKKNKDETVPMNQTKTNKKPWWNHLGEPESSISTGKMTGDVIIARVEAGATNVAIGKNIHQVITDLLGDPKPNDKAIIESHVNQLRSRIETLDNKVDAAIRETAIFHLGLLQGELTKTEENQIPSASTITQVGNWLLDNIPDLTETLVSLFATPAVGRVVGKAGDSALQWIRLRLGSQSEVS